MGFSPGLGRRVWVALGALLSTGAGGCIIDDVMIADFRDIVVAEVMVQFRDEGPGSFRPQVFALLHTTLGPHGHARPVDGAEIVVRGPGGIVHLRPRPASSAIECATELPPHDVACYRADAADESRVRPGDSLSVEIHLPDGRRLFGSTVAPSDFRLLNLPEAGTCTLGPATLMTLRWTSSAGASGYVAEASLQHPLLPREDGLLRQLHLTGISLAQDTTIVFPSEFGLLERFGDSSEILVSFQKGLWEGVFARLSITAAELNYFNWHRASAFNPSGQVRVPSLRGDGTGYFGATVVRTLTVWTPPREGQDAERDPPCL